MDHPRPGMVNPGPGETHLAGNCLVPGHGKARLMGSCENEPGNGSQRMLKLQEFQYDLAEVGTDARRPRCPTDGRTPWCGHSPRCVSNSTCFAANSGCRKNTPVMLPPGRARLFT